LFLDDFFRNLFSRRGDTFNVERLFPQPARVRLGLHVAIASQYLAELPEGSDSYAAADFRMAFM
jgi:hypothetical protein